MKILLHLVIVFWLSAFQCDASIKDPAWKHCIIPLHAMPGGWAKVTSPGYPGGITRQIQCSWVVNSNPGFRIKLAFQTLNLTGSQKSCYTQFVEVIDYKRGHSVGKFCGTRRPGDYVSYGKSLQAGIVHYHILNLNFHASGSKLRFDLQGDTAGDKTQGFDIRFKATREPPGFKSSWAFAAPSPPMRSRPKTPKRKPRPPKRKKPPAPVRKPPSSSNTIRRPPSKPAAPPGLKPPSAKPLTTRRIVAMPTPKAPPPRAKPRPPPGSNRFSASRPAPPIIRPPANRPPVQAIPPPNYHRSRGPVSGGGSVISKPKKEAESELNLYLIGGIAGAGVLALIIIFVIMKICVFDKRKEKRKRRKEQMEQRNREMKAKEAFPMSMMSNVVPDHYMSEEIVPQSAQPYHHPQPLPMMSSMPRHQYPIPFTHSVRARKSTTAPPMMRTRSVRSTRSTRSRHLRRSGSTRSRAASRRSEIPRSKSRSSMREGRSKSSVKRSKSKIIAYPPPMEGGQWMVVPAPNGFPQAETAVYPYYAQNVATESSTSDSSSSEWESSSSESNDGKRNYYIENGRYSVMTKRSKPPSYDSLNPKPLYYVTEKAYDEGYGTVKHGKKSKAGRRKKKRSRASDWERGKKKKPRSRKYSY